MVFRLNGLVVGLLAPFLVSCTTELEVSHLTKGAPPPPGNYLYVLPKVYFAVTGSVTLTGCDAVAVDAEGNEVDPAAAGHKPVAGYQPGLSLTEVVSASPVVIADGDQQYAVPYEKLRSWKKETNFTITANANKTLSGVNAAINDQGGPVVLQGTLAAVQIAGGVAVPALAPALIAPAVVKAAGGGLTFSGVHKGKKGKKKPVVAPKPVAVAPPPSFCTPKVMNALAMITAANRQIYTLSKADAAAKVTIANPNIAKIQAQIARLQNDAQLVRPISSKLDPNDASRNQPALKLTVPVFNEAIKPWLTDTAAAWYADATHRTNFQSARAIYDSVVVQVDLDDWTVVKTAAPPEKTAGLVLRDPATGTLRLCRGECVANAATNDIAAPQAVSIPQFGRILQFPLRNGTFENSSLAIATTADGTITSMGNHSTGTLSTNLATAGQIGTAIGNATTARNTAVTAQNGAAVAAVQFPDTYNKALADCLTQQAAARAAGGTPLGACQ